MGPSRPIPSNAHQCLPGAFFMPASFLVTRLPLERLSARSPISCGLPKNGSAVVPLVCRRITDNLVALLILFYNNTAVYPQETPTWPLISDPRRRRVFRTPSENFVQSTPQYPDCPKLANLPKRKSTADCWSLVAVTSSLLTVPAPLHDHPVCAPIFERANLPHVRPEYGAPSVRIQTFSDSTTRKKQSLKTRYCQRRH